MKTVLMYHGVGAGEQLDGSDPHYGVSGARLRRHLEILGESVALSAQLARGGIEAHCVTFDDGHVSHFSTAFPILSDAGFTGEFYVNSALIGERHCMTWAQVREMTDAGMSIQSHGHRHRYLSDLSDAELRDELETSKRAIEDATGREVVVLAPPGGRYDARTLAIARELGYRRLAISRPGRWKSFGATLVPRFPVYQWTSEDVVAQYLSSWSRASAMAALKYEVTGLAKRLLGNGAYERIRNGMLGQYGSAGGGGIVP